MAPKTDPIQIDAPTPARTMNKEKNQLFLSKRTVETIRPCIGIMRGATITVVIEEEGGGGGEMKKRIRLGAWSVCFGVAYFTIVDTY